MKNEKMTAVIAQRVKLGLGDMSRATFDEALARLVSQDREMTQEEIAVEVARVKALTEQTREQAEAYKAMTPEELEAEVDRLELDEQTMHSWATQLLAALGEELKAQLPEEEAEDLELAGTALDVHGLSRVVAHCVLTQFAKVRSEGNADIYEVSESELPLRQTLAAAAVLNLKATDKLPEEWGEMTDEQLTAMVCFASEVDHYCSQKAAFKFDQEAAINALGRICLGGFVLLILAPAAGLTVTSGLLILGAISAMILVVETIDAMLPAGLDETRLGVTIKMKAAEAGRAARALLVKCVRMVNDLLVKLGLKAPAETVEACEEEETSDLEENYEEEAVCEEEEGVVYA